MPVDDRPTLAAPDDDPYLWLEEVDGDRALAFVERQNDLTLATFGNAGFVADRDLLAAIYDRPDNIPYVTRRGGLPTVGQCVHWRRVAIDEIANMATRRRCAVHCSRHPAASTPT